MSAKNEISARFIEAFEALLANGYVSDKRDFAAKLGISASMVTEISKGRSSVGTLSVQNIVSQFNINADWLLTGRGEMLADGAPPVSAAPQPAAADQQPAPLISSLLATIREQATEIGRLQERIRQQERDLERLASDARTSDIAGAG